MKPGPARPGKIEENRSPAQPGPAILSRGVARPSANRNKQKTSAIQNHPARFFSAPGKIRRSETNYATRLDAVGFELQDNQSGSPGSAKCGTSALRFSACSDLGHRAKAGLSLLCARSSPIQTGSLLQNLRWNAARLGLLPAGWFTPVCSSNPPSGAIRPGKTDRKLLPSGPDVQIGPARPGPARQEK